MSGRDLRFRRAEERGEELEEAQYQQRRILEDEIIEAERLLRDRGYVVIAYCRTPVVARSLEEFLSWRDGKTPQRGLEVYVPPPDPKPVFVPRQPRPPGPPRGNRYRR